MICPKFLIFSSDTTWGYDAKTKFVEVSIFNTQTPVGSMTTLFPSISPCELTSRWCMQSLGILFFYIRTIL